MHIEHIQITIFEELDKMRSIMENSPEKIGEIISEFNEQTPAILRVIREHIAAGRFIEAASALHKVKVRYSYFGFEDLFEKLQAWERAFKAGESVVGIGEEFNKIEETTAMIIDVLKSINLDTLMQKSDTTALPLVGKKVLVAEDDEINAMVFEAFIQELGGEILMAQDGFEAINQATESAPDLIFMDVHMPYCNGLDAIKTLRSRGVTTPIISLSASSRLNERDESLQAGANDFITKPANRHAIKQALLKHIG